MFDLLVDTLIMVCPDFNTTSDSEIEEYLSELEGDYYSFFDKVSLMPLCKNGILTENQMNSIVDLKNIINSIPPALWNKESFQNNSKWKIASELSNNILNSLGISAYRRKG